MYFQLQLFVLICCCHAGEIKYFHNLNIIVIIFLALGRYNPEGALLFFYFN